MSAVTAMSAFGADLTASDCAALAKRWIDRPTADAALLRRVDNFTGRDVVGAKRGDYAGILIPNVFDGNVREYSIRRDSPEIELREGLRREIKKYARPIGRPNLVYFAPAMPAALLAQIDLPLLVVEGEFKTLAAWRLSSYDSSVPRFVPIGFSGVWNFRGTIGKTTGPSGDRRDVRGIIPDVDRIQWTGRKVIIAYDADASEKSSVRSARAILARELRSRGAEVAFFEWDGKSGKGIDDYIATVGPEVVLGRLDAVSFDHGDWTANLIANRDGAPRALLANGISALRSKVWEGVLAHNEFTLGTVALKPTPWGETVSSWSDHEDRLTADWLQHQGIYVGVDVAAQAVQVVSQDRCFHPVRTYLSGLRWDGDKRLDSWLSRYLGAEWKDYTSAVGLRWMISAVARIFQPGCKADCVLILEGAQGIRKSTALKTIAGEEWFTDEIADLGSKDSAMQAAGVWIVELAELDSMNRSEVSRIKAFVSRSTDRFRPPYGKRVIEAARQSVFAGSVNHQEYLRDSSGGRRFWPVTCTNIDIEQLAADRDQLWAEAVALYREGYVWWLDSATLNEQAEEEQADRFDEDPWQQLIQAWLDCPSQRMDASGHPIDPFTSTDESITVTDVLLHAIGKQGGQFNNADGKRVSQVLQALKWERFKSGPRKNRQWRYRPATVSQVDGRVPGVSQVEK